MKKGLAGWTDQGGLYFHLCTCAQAEGRLGVAAVVLFVVQEMVCIWEVQEQDASPQEGILLWGTHSRCWLLHMQPPIKSPQTTAN